jgi:uncharacterized protein YggT (Ycf19 family)
MALFDFILNLTALLLWLSWCWRPLDPFVKNTPASIMGTVRRAEPASARRWHLLAGLILLLVTRALFYRQVGSAIGWTPKLDLGFVVLALRSDRYGSVFLYSLLSFWRVWIIYYFWLLTVMLVNRAAAEPDPLQKLLRVQLGWVRGWPWPVLVLLPAIGVTALWAVLHPVLQRVGVLTPPQGIMHLLEQSLLLTLSLVLSLKYLMPVFLLLDLVSSYVYLGTSPVWDFVASTSGNLLKPLRGLPLRLAKVDLAPLLGTIFILVVLHWFPNAVIQELDKRKIAFWPQ